MLQTDYSNLIELQIPTDQLIQSFNPNDCDADKSNPYHGVLTLFLQQKATYNQSHNGATPRGPGRPPIHDLNVDELSEIEDTVSKRKKVEPALAD